MRGSRWRLFDASVVCSAGLPRDACLVQTELEISIAYLDRWEAYKGPRSFKSHFILTFFNLRPTFSFWLSSTSDSRLNIKLSSFQYPEAFRFSKSSFKIKNWFNGIGKARCCFFKCHYFVDHHGWFSSLGRSHFRQKKWLHHCWSRKETVLKLNSQHGAQRLTFDLWMRLSSWWIECEFDETCVLFYQRGFRVHEQNASLMSFVFWNFECESHELWV